MNKKGKIRIVFMGTPEFAVNILVSLMQGRLYEVVGVVTVPDKPIGRHASVLQFSPVKTYALSKGLPILQPENMEDETFLSALNKLNADLQVVVAFRILPKVVWNMPRLGTFNLHASLLPNYRGAAPINWAIINGETCTGVTTFYLDENIDTGHIIRRKKLKIGEDDNFKIVHDGLMRKGASLVQETIRAILKDNDKPREQEFLIKKGKISLKPAPKIFKETCRIDWHQPVKRIYDFIRGLSPYPAAWTEIVSPEGVRTTLKIYQAEKHFVAHELPVGIVRTDRKSYIDVAVEDGYLRLLSIQLAGKKRLPVADFLNGFKQIGEYKVD